MSQHPAWLAALLEPPTVKKPIAGIPDPAGFAKDVAVSTKKQSRDVAGPSPQQNDQLKVKKAWEVAMGPSKSLPMNAIMSYFSGSSLQIFSLTMTFMLFSAPVKAIFSVNPMFARFQSETNSAEILKAKLVFILLNLLTIGVGIWKMGTMGVLPTKRSDWLAWESEVPSLETAGFVL
ncbi:uncharacterized protein V1510DRAFT_416156 [Dipodascopsis tothii]|uniref:uncharacterized protein n=1 Tax=Dipodascopsis tothii TaxID=44089 RepID=UPI0034CDB538